MEHPETGQAATDETTPDPRRRFRRADIRRAWELQGKVCNLCRREIPFDLIHGDHIQPHSKGGRTEFANLQALCGSCNLRKGSHPQEYAEQFFDIASLDPGQAILRPWQSEALQTVIPLLQKRQPVLIEACPGAGKTLFGLTLAYDLIEQGHISRVLVIVPTRAIAKGWADAASRLDPMAPTLPLRTSDDWRVTDPIDPYDSHQIVGAVSTYQALSAMPDMFLAHATEPGHRTLVVFDEVHHAGANSSWGIAAQESFAAAAHSVLALTGTPFRTDRDPIAFVSSENGRALSNYRYGYAQALADGACRPVQFVEIGGTVTFKDQDGNTSTITFGDKELSSLGERRILRAALEWMGPNGIAERLITEANRFLLELRSNGDPDAAALVVCVDCDHADNIADYMRNSMGIPGVNVAYSKSYDANDRTPGKTIGRFRNSSDPWIVAVNMISEGVDIKRLRAVVYLTNRSTELSFRQIVGRVVRTDQANQNDYGRVYLPGDPTLLEMSRNIRNEVRALPPPITIEVEPGPPATVEGLTSANQLTAVEVLETSAVPGDVFDTSNRVAERTFIDRCQEYIDLKGLTGTSPEWLALEAESTPRLKSAIEESTNQ